MAPLAGKSPAGSDHVLMRPSHCQPALSAGTGYWDKTLEIDIYKKIKGNSKDKGKDKDKDAAGAGAGAEDTDTDTDTDIL